MKSVIDCEQLFVTVCLSSVLLHGRCDRARLFYSPCVSANENQLTGKYADRVATFRSMRIYKAAMLPGAVEPQFLLSLLRVCRYLLPLNVNQ